MEGDGGMATPDATLTSLPPSVDPDFSPIGSPVFAGHHLGAEVPPPPSEFPEADVPGVTDDIRDKIIKQVEYYFSDENLSTDKFMMKQMAKNEESSVPIEIIASFRKMKKLTKDISLIVAALKGSSSLIVSSDGKKVKRRIPLPFTEVNDPQLSTVLVENLPEDHSAENMHRIFGVAGNVKNMCIRDPNVAREARKHTIAEKLLFGKLHALVEYETIDAAEKAVATLNNEQDWRYGMRVKLLIKRGKNGQKKKEQNVLDLEKNGCIQASDIAVENEENYRPSQPNDDSCEDGQDGENKPKEKHGHKDRNRGRPRRQKHRGANGHGHGMASSNHVNEILKPPPGPRMPDGTRGFTMGRGRPLASSGS